MPDLLARIQSDVATPRLTQCDLLDTLHPSCYVLPMNAILLPRSCGTRLIGFGRRLLVSTRSQTPHDTYRHWHWIGCVAVFLWSNLLWGAERGATDFTASPSQPVGWHGDGSGHFPGAKPVDSCDPAALRNVRWVTEVPQSGGASPVPVGDLVLVMVEPDVLMAFSRRDGKKVWESPVDLVADTAKAELVRPILRRGLATPSKEQKPVWDEAAKVAGGGRIGPGEFRWAIPTPVSDGKTIWVTLSTGVVAAFDLAGKRLWRMEQTKAGGGNASPLFVDGRLLIWGRSGVVALTPETGAERWSATFAKEQQTGRFGTPAVWKNAGNTYLIGSNRIAVRVSDGMIAQTNAELRSNEASPMVIGNRIIFTQGNDHGGGEQTLEGCDLAIAGDRLTLTPVWKRLTSTSPKQTYRDFTRVTPLVVGKVFCTVIESTKNGLLFGDLATGVDVDQRLPVVCAGSVHAWSPSPIQAGGLVILPHRDGKVEILKPGTPWTLASAFSLDAPMSASPSASGGDLFLLTGKSLYCIGAK